MEIPFTAAARAVEDTFMHEEMRLVMTHSHGHSLRGFCVPMEDHLMAAWRRRLASLQLAGALLRVITDPALAAAVRALDPRLEEIAGRLEAMASIEPGPLWP